MLTHGDPEVQALFGLLEDQRDKAMLRAGVLAAEVDRLNKKLAEGEKPALVPVDDPQP